MLAAAIVGPEGPLWKTLVRGLHNIAGLDSPYSQTEYGRNRTKQRQKCLERDDHVSRVWRVRG